ncbi:MAG TPA: hypothetical protein VNG69_14525 [Casimicrobiaceae bacterium]|nr:hypothetical protein [Casimicrobiaceae bacterium]
MRIDARTRTDARALSAFLHDHLGVVERNDVGPLIGQAALIRERGAASVLPLSGESGWNAALSGEAPSSTRTLPHNAALARRKARIR